MPRRRATRRPKRRAAKKRTYRSKGGRTSKQMAKILETIEYNNVAPNVVQAMTFTINQFERARTLATNFRWYKPTYVTWTIEPQFNTFQSGINANSVPYMYKIMNRSQDPSFMTLSDILSQGAKPMKLISQKKISYRPNWCSPGLIVQNVVAQQGFGGALNNVYINGLTPQYGWLQAPNLLPTGTSGSGQPLVPGTISSLQPGDPRATGPALNLAANTVFNGHQVYIEQQTAPQSTPVYKVSCTVSWSFKDPKNTLANPYDNLFETFAPLDPEVVPE